MNLFDVQDKLLVTGGTGMVGVALQKVLPHATYVGSKYDLTNFDRTMELFEEVKPEYVVHLAAKVSGMKGNMDALGTHYTESVYEHECIGGKQNSQCDKGSLSFKHLCVSRVCQTALCRGRHSQGHASLHQYGIWLFQANA